MTLCWKIKFVKLLQGPIVIVKYFPFSLVFFYIHLSFLKTDIVFFSICNCFVNLFSSFIVK